MTIISTDSNFYQSINYSESHVFTNDDANLSYPNLTWQMLILSTRSDSHLYCASYSLLQFLSFPNSSDFLTISPVFLIFARNCHPLHLLLFCQIVQLYNVELYLTHFDQTEMIIRSRLQNYYKFFLLKIYYFWKLFSINAKITNLITSLKERPTNF